MKRPEPRTDTPISRIFSVEELDALPNGQLTIKATPEECAALAAANDLPDVARLEARLRVVPEKRGYDVIGEVRGTVTQTCVVTLEKFQTDFAEPIEVRFEPVAPPPRATKAKRAPEKASPPPDEEIGEDPPEPITDGYADIGVAIGEFFALGLDPYPRKPGAAFDPASLGAPPVAAAPEEEAKENPFAALAKLKKDADKS